MIAALRGTVVAKDAEGAVLDCGGVGYAVTMPLSSLAALPGVGQEAHVFVYTHVAQDVLRLFGFCEARERETFRVLISLQRVGPKLAIGILSALSPQELAEAVQRNDLAALSRIPGVGKKTAERLLLELRDKLPKVLTPHAPSPVADRHGDLVSALVNLGYDEGEADATARAIAEAHPDEHNVALLVREALRKLTRR